MKNIPKAIIMTVSLINLKKSFNKKIAVNISNIEIADGTILGLVGNNGAGKTTLFRLALDLLKPDSGKTILKFKLSDGSTFATDVAVDEEWKKYTGAFIDESFLIDFLSPEEYFEFIAKVNNIDKVTMYERLKTFATFMNGEIIGQKKLIRSMSAGNKQKIGIVSAMLSYPQLLILDEPFNFLDPTSQNILKKLLVEYNNQYGATILVSSHNLSHTIDISNRIIVMEHGQPVKDFAKIDEHAISELKNYFCE